MKILLSWIKLENKLSFLQALKIKTQSEELQDYKVKSVKGLQGYIWRVTRLQEGNDYKSLYEGKGELSGT